MSLKNLQIENKNFIDNSLEATVHLFYHVDLFVRFDNDDEVSQDYLNFNKMKREFGVNNLTIGENKRN